MTTLLHVVDAFTDTPFRGNPAAVCCLDGPADEQWMRDVAREMNLSETAFTHPIEGGFSLRWLTPRVEVKLCGHATLATAHVLWHTGAAAPDAAIRFHTRSGWITCRRDGNWIEMDFPAVACTPCEPPSGLAAALRCPLVACGSNGMDYLVELADERSVRAVAADHTLLRTLPVRGVIVTAASDDSRFDFVSRFFAPGAGIDEDPVTGSAHCALGPYWQAKHGKDDFMALQASERTGVVGVGVRGDRVLLRGQAVLVSRVELLPERPPAASS